MLPREFLRENAARLLREMPERFGGSGLETYTDLDAERREAVTRLEEKRRRRNEISSLRGKPDPATLAEMKTLKEEIRALEERVEEADRKLDGGREAGSQCPAGHGSARHRRVREPRRAHVGRAAPVRLRAPGALGPRPGARHPRLRARRQDRGCAIHGPLGRRRAPVPGAHPVLSRRARRGARLPGGAAAVSSSTPIPSSARDSFPSSSRISSRHGRATTSSPRPRSR